jgi:hypothetical protein
MAFLWEIAQVLNVQFVPATVTKLFAVKGGVFTPDPTSRYWNFT